MNTGSACSSSCGNCGCEGGRQHGNLQLAVNVTASLNKQHINQDAPTYVTAKAVNPSLTVPVWNGCDRCNGYGNGYGSIQNATAIAAANPVLSASQELINSASGSAANIDTGSNSGSCGYCNRGRQQGNLQLALNVTLSATSQKINQYAPTYVTAKAVNYPTVIGDEHNCNRCEAGSYGSVQNATAVAAANPVLAASQASYFDSVKGQATNVALGGSCSSCGSSHNGGAQVAINVTASFPSQRINQDGATWVDATAKNDGFGLGGSQQSTAAAIAAPRLAASQYQYDYLTGSASNVNLSSGSGNQIALNVTYNDGDQSIKQYAPSYVTAKAENSSSNLWGECGCNYGGFGGEQNATAIAGAATVLTASQMQSNEAVGAASNLNLGSSCGYCCGYCGYGHGHGSNQFAFNLTTNNVNQSIVQVAPAWASAKATNENLPFLWSCWSGCYGGPQNATAIATATPSLHASQSSISYVHGAATNVNLSSSFGGYSNCGCQRDSYGNQGQFAFNHTHNSVDQDLFQFGPAKSKSYAYNPPTFFTGLWGGEYGNSVCGQCSGGLGGLRANAAYVPTYSAPVISAPVAYSGLPLSGIGTNYNVAGASNLGIKLGLNVSNSEVLNLPTISQLLHGVTLFGLLHGLVSVNLSLSVTTPWAQVAVAVAHESPFAVLFSVSAQHSLAPWYGYLL